MDSSPWCAVASLLVLGSLTAAGDTRCNQHGVFDDNWDECACEKGYAGDACEACEDGYAGWPTCEHIPGRSSSGDKQNKLDKMAGYGWQHLCSEVSSLRSSLPEYLVRLGELYEARQVVDGKLLRLRSDDVGKGFSPFWGTDASGNCSSAGGRGPWKLKVDVSAPSGAPKVFSKHHRIVLVFNQDWPVVLPSVRFVGKIRTIYATSSDQQQQFAQDLHTAEANGLLLRRLQEAAGGTVSCMWRQTANCARDGSNREPEKDKLCDATVPLGASGFCDCDGDGERGATEQAYGCDQTPGTCASVCKAAPASRKAKGAATSSKGPPRHTLRGLLETLHKSLGGPLESADQSMWKSALSEFKREASTVLKYKKYGHAYPQLYQIGGTPDEQMIDPSLRAAIANALAKSTRAEAKQSLLDAGVISEVLPEMVFSFRVFTDEFSSLLMKEIHHFYASKLPARRPNSMNNYGIILNEIGLEPLVFAMQDVVIQPLAAILLPEEGSELESHHSFTIRYRGGEDTHLDVHTDDSDITFNVNVFGDYTGAPLVFCGINGEPDHRQFKTAYQHKLGYAVLHRGRHRHGAEDITSGERMNLVVWSYSHAYRSSSASEKVTKREAAKPNSRCVSYTHDRDFSQFKEYPPGKRERHFGRGWCPPRGKEYEGFVPDLPDSQRQQQQQQPGQ